MRMSFDSLCGVVKNELDWALLKEGAYIYQQFP
jgi:hypothetical protein